MSPSPALINIVPSRSAWGVRGGGLWVDEMSTCTGTKGVVLGQEPLEPDTSNDGMVDSTGRGRKAA